MEYTVELNSVRDFDFWSGAEAVAKLINNHPKADVIWDTLDECLECSSHLTETDINDFIMFDAENFIKNTLGIDINEDED